MVEDFLLDIEIVGGPTTREKDGLTMGSRNVFLGDRRRKVACVLYRALRAAEEMYMAGTLQTTKIMAAAREVIRSEEAKQEALGPAQRARFTIEFLKLADPKSLEEVEEVDPRIGAMVSGSIVMLPLDKEPGPEGENRGLNDGNDKIRMIDYVVLKPWAPLITNV
ncbi:MAG: pantothenate synthase [Icmadophila ericetorum]|nr:pantothenate synthase [Icmadophila ericetorum]